MNCDYDYDGNDYENDNDDIAGNGEADDFPEDDNLFLEDDDF